MDRPINSGGSRRERVAGGREAGRTVIRHSAEELAALDALASEMGRSRASLYEWALRVAGRGGTFGVTQRLEVIRSEQRYILRVFKGVATNLNQIARALNATGESPEHLDEALASVARLCDDLRGSVAKIDTILESI